MKVVIVGTGYVGLVTGACLAEAGNEVACVDSNEDKIRSLRAGHIPFYEPDLEELVCPLQAAGRLTFTTCLAEACCDARVVFLAVGTPSGEDGCADINGLLACAAELADALSAPCLVVVKSTAPVGTCERLQRVLDKRLHQAGWSVEVASNPEFLAEGRAVADFRRPSRIVIGAASVAAAETLRTLYQPFDSGGQKILTMDVRSAEFAKYACNAMLAARISFINELAGIAGRLGADIQPVCRVLQTDPRIGGQYLQPGAGFGGSCLPKDLRALIRMAQDRHEPATLLRSIEHVNQRQIKLLFEAIGTHLGGDVRGRCIAIWGLAFKPGTDDIREAPSIALVSQLLAAGAKVRAFDPVAMPAVRRLIASPNLILADTADHALQGADVLVVMTEWDEFRAPDFDAMAGMLKARAIFDARHLYRRQDVMRHRLSHYRPGDDVRFMPRTPTARGRSDARLPPSQTSGRDAHAVDTGAPPA
ncbi:UDP-glucose/GDP-mannose dehydrogenase family protein [Parapusillimonas sp. SGNA-6]|nr:UDP-glucose/GDP-mannose dehydrogenase family protein [Parapusillimonas sp. SGNA-6]